MKQDSNSRSIIAIAAGILVLSVLMGAFGAHSLEDQLSVDQMTTFETGLTYQFYHALGLLFIGLYVKMKPSINLTWTVVFFCMGILLFSGSIYLLATKDLTGLSTRILGPITPLGGMFLVLGWASLLWAVVRSRP